ncbi:MAG: TauD/TfdA dioxygenase family protein [Myxococcota bacterium]
MYQQIRVEPMAGALGAEVSGVELQKPLDGEKLAEIRRAWLAHQVLFFRDQPLSVDEHKAFARRFGELHIHPVLQQMADQGHPEIVVLESDARRPVVADRWHSDVTFEREPPLGSILRAVEVPEMGGDTMWASMTAAYDALSEPMKALLAPLRASHSGAGFRRRATEDQRDALAQNETHSHPVIRTHPETGRRAIFVNSAFTRSIDGMKPRESAALLEFLFEHLTSPEFSCRFRWRKHSIAMWDNRCTQHRVVADNLTAYRRMERVTLLGDRPY